MTQEQISALVDNELSDQHVELALAALRQADGRATWDVYHQIGDVLRSDDMANEFSPDFTARLMTRLDAEPTIMAPQAKPVQEQLPLVAAGGAAVRNTPFRRFIAPTAVAAVAVLALIASPQLTTALKGGVAKDQLLTQMVVSKDKPGPLEQVAVQDASFSTATQNGVVLRDPRIDQYLLAHQRFSPAWNSTAQYARSATFASDSDK
ncbi:MAG TPA: sigma-E factor negative regulatory protein [Burkholderiaceae bacterium]|nr:sigma-E factor negative regulatory protein [Burkholderiaceae bacterium]